MIRVGLAWKRVAYVIPVYEVSENVTRPPRNKPELMKLVKQDLARQYHEKWWWKNSGYTNYKK